MLWLSRPWVFNVAALDSCTVCQKSGQPLGRAKVLVITWGALTPAMSGRFRVAAQQAREPARARWEHVAPTTNRYLASIALELNSFRSSSQSPYRLLPFDPNVYQAVAPVGSRHWIQTPPRHVWNQDVHLRALDTSMYGNYSTEDTTIQKRWQHQQTSEVDRRATSTITAITKRMRRRRRRRRRGVKR